MSALANPQPFPITLTRSFHKLKQRQLKNYRNFSDIIKITYQLSKKVDLLLKILDCPVEHKLIEVPQIVFWSLIQIGSISLSRKP